MDAHLYLEIAGLGANWMHVARSIHFAKCVVCLIDMYIDIMSSWASKVPPPLGPLWGFFEFAEWDTDESIRTRRVSWTFPGACDAPVEITLDLVQLYMLTPHAHLRAFAKEPSGLRLERPAWAVVPTTRPCMLARCTDPQYIAISVSVLLSLGAPLLLAPCHVDDEEGRGSQPAKNSTHCLSPAQMYGATYMWALTSCPSSGPLVDRLPPGERSCWLAPTHPLAPI